LYQAAVFIITISLKEICVLCQWKKYFEWCNIFVRCVLWSYEECEGEYAEWQMYPLAIDTTLSECPILAGIYVTKKEIKS